MKIIVQNARLISPSHSLHNQLVDISIIDGTIIEIGKNLQAGDEWTIIAEDNLCVSPGWTDCFAHFSDPGEEYNEDIQSGARAAAAGGYTDVMTVPNTSPVIDNKGQIDYILEKGKQTAVNILPAGAITQKTEGKSLAEMYDMTKAGAVAFTDGYSPVQSSGVMLKALEYVLAIDSTIIQIPDDKSIGTSGQMNEGIISTQIGMPGKPAIAEEFFLARDIEILRYTNSRLHVTGISSKKSAELIGRAKNDGLKITCSTTPYHLFFSDKDIAGYNTNLKVNPPLRTESDRQAIIDAVKNGTIDFIASHHHPLDFDHKVCEFQHASFGMETLEAVFGAVRAVGIPAEKFVTMQTRNIRKAFNLPEVKINKNTPACLTLFKEEGAHLFSKNDIRSRCTNNAFIGYTLKGKVVGTINKEKITINNQPFGG